MEVAMNFLESKGVKVEIINPIIGKLTDKGMSPESLQLYFGESKKKIELDTTDDMLYIQAKEIDDNDVEAVFAHLKKIRDQINWLI